MRDTSTVINIIFKTAEAADIKLKDNYSLYEASEALRIGWSKPSWSLVLVYLLLLSLERALEDHEIIKDVMELWPSKNQPILKLKPFITKNDLWIAKRSPVR